MKSFEYLVGMTTENLKKKMQKKNDFQDFEVQIRKLKESEDSAVECLFADELKIGVVTVNVKDLREMVEQKIQKGTKV